MNIRHSLVAGSLVILALVSAAAGVAAAPAASSVKASNQYIQLTVGNGELDTARFGIDTTGGDPTRTGDENQPLIYGGGPHGLHSPPYGSTARIMFSEAKRSAGPASRACLALKRPRPGKWMPTR